MKIGDCVFITALEHPWRGCAGKIVATHEKYGLGWEGHRVELDNGMQTYVKESEVMGPGRVDKMTLTSKRKPKKSALPSEPTEKERP